jgi:hypothetical protein
MKKIHKCHRLPGIGSGILPFKPFLGAFLPYKYRLYFFSRAEKHKPVV